MKVMCTGMNVHIIQPRSYTAREGFFVVSCYIIYCVPGFNLINLPAGLRQTSLSILESREPAVQSAGGLRVGIVCLASVPLPLQLIKSSGTVNWSLPPP